MKNPKCECADAGCKAHKGASECKAESSLLVERPDYEEGCSFAMCEECSADACESGIFSTVAALHCGRPEPLPNESNCFMCGAAFVPASGENCCATCCAEEAEIDAEERSK